MAQESPITFLNGSEVVEGNYVLTIAFPLHLPDENPQYLAQVRPDQTVLDLKNIIHLGLRSTPSTGNQRVIFGGRILENDQTFGSLLGEVIYTVLEHPIFLKK